MKKKIGIISLSVILLISLLTESGVVFGSRFGSELFNQPSKLNEVTENGNVIGNEAGNIDSVIELEKKNPVVEGETRASGDTFFVGINSCEIYFTVLTEPTQGSNGTVAIGDNSYFSGADTLVFGETVTYGGKTYTITEVSADAFKTAILVSITLPNTITEIGDRAFENCTDLKDIILPTNSLTKIGARAFAGTVITKMNIPEGVTYVGSETFAECKKLSSVNFPTTLIKIGHMIFGSSFDSLNYNLRSVRFPVEVKSELLLNDTDIDGNTYKGAVFEGIVSSVVIVAKDKSNANTLKKARPFIGSSSNEVDTVTYEIEMSYYDKNHNLLANMPQTKKLWGQSIAYYQTEDGFWDMFNNYACVGLPTLPTSLGYPAKYWGLGQYSVVTVDPALEDNNISKSTSMVTNGNNATVNGKSDRVYIDKLYAVEEAFKITPTLTYNTDSTEAQLVLQLNRNIQENLDTKNGEHLIIKTYLDSNQTIGNREALKNGGDSYVIDFLNVAETGNYGYILEYCIKEEKELGGTSENIMWSTNPNGKNYSSIVSDLKIPVVLNKKKILVNPVTEKSIIWNVQTALPAIELAEGDTEGTITWDAGQTPTLGKKSYTYTFTPTKVQGVNKVDKTIKEFIYEGVNSLDYTYTRSIEIDYAKATNKVTFNDWDGTVLKEAQDVAFEAAAIPPAVPTREGYTFAGWDKDFSIVTSELTVTAMYTINQYKVKFTGKDGGVIKEQTLDYGSTITAPTAPKVEGYEFIGWNPVVPEKVPAKNSQYVAQYKLCEYDVSFNLNGGDGTAPTTIKRGYQALLGELSTPIKTGYEFMGWYDAETNGTKYTKDSKMPAKPLTLYAQWRINQYTVSFNVNGGDSTTPTSITANYGSPLGELSVPTRKGYKFKGWYDASTGGNKVESTSTIPAKHITLYAQWEIIEYTISYDLNEENASSVVNNNKIKYTVKDETFTLNEPTLTDHVFIGWTCGDIQKPTKEVTIENGSTGNKNYKAHWVDSQYTVNFDSQGGTSVASQNIAYLGKVTIPSVLTKTGHSFIGWYTDENYTTAWNFENAVTSNLTLFAKWGINQYTVSFDANGGDAISQTITGDYDSLLDNPPVATRTGYDFKGWYKEQACDTSIGESPKMPADNVTYYAKWEVHSYTISYIDAEGHSNPTKYTILSEDITLKAPEKAGHDFKGWKLNDEGNVQESVTIKSGSAGNLSYTAQWEKKKYTVTFDSGVQSQEVAYQDKVTKPSDPTKKGYEFKGWFTDTNYATAWNFENAVTSNLTVYAKWEINKYTVSFDVNGGDSTAPENKTVTYDTVLGTLSVPTKKGYKFMGWYDAKTGGKEVTEDTKMPANALTLYAQWELVKYKISYVDAKGHSNPTEYTILSENLTLKAPEKVGHDFKGWKLNGTGEALMSVTILTGSTGDLSYTAQWEKKKYTVNFDSQDGTSVASQNVAYLDKVTIPSVPPTKTGYEFKGWFTDTHYATAWDFKNDMIEDSRTLYAKWEVVSYKIIYHLEDGKIDGEYPETYTILSEAITLKAPKKVGHDFIGWKLNGTGEALMSVTIPTGSTENKEYTAVWKVIDYTIAYDLKDGNNHADNPTSYQVISENIVLKAPTKTGYEFMGWTWDNQSTPQLNVTLNKGSVGNKAYIAHWTVNQYTASFNGNGGSNGADITVDYNAPLGELQVSSREGYTFDGWFTMADGGTQITSKTLMPLDGATYYAHWTIKTNTVSFDSHGGNIVTSKITGKYDTELGNLPETSRKGYEFMGWFTEKAGGTKISSTSKIPAQDTTYFAQWVIEEYRISYDLNDDNTGHAKNDPANKEKYTIEEALTLKAPSFDKHVFIGWTNETILIPEMNVVIKQGTIGNKSYKANWVNSDYTVSFDSQGGSQVGTQGAKYQGLVIKPGDPSKAGHTFKGWYKEKECTTVWDFASNKVSSNLTLYAKWEVNQYTASFDANGGESVTPSSMKKNYGEALGTLPECSKVGHLFKGWFTEVTGGSEINEQTTMIDRNITYYAHWEVIQYTATFDGNGGSNGIDIIVDYQTVLGKLPGSSRDGYTFDGWFTSKIGGTKVTEETVMPLNGVTYYAHWTVIQYTASFNGNGGSDGADITVDYNAPLGELLVSSREGYTFDGWYDAISGGNKIDTTTKMPLDGATYYAHWTIKTNTVSFDSQGGSIVTSKITGKYDTELGDLPETSRKGYEFMGWFTEKSGGTKISSTSKIPAENKTYFAQWKIEEYSISYDLNDGNTGQAKNDPANKEKYTIEESLTLKAPSFDKHVFIGWTNETILTPEMNVEIKQGTIGNKSYKANWVNSDYTVSFDSQGGSQVGTQGAKYQGLVIKPGDPSKAGHTFKGWYKEKECTTVWDFASNKVSSNLTLYAKWEVNQYTASFDANGGESVTPSSMKKNYGEALGTLPTCSKVGHLFKGWFTEVTGGSEITEQTTMIDRNITYYAHWEVRQYTATFDGNGGSDGTDITVDYQTVLGKLPGSSRDGYTFDGWFTSKIGGTKVTEETVMPLNGVTYYAHWTVIQYTASFDSNGGNVVSETIKKDYGSMLGNLPIPTKTGHTFDGWYDAITGGNKIGTTTKMPLNGATYFAHWKVNQYTVSFDSQGGSKVNETIKKDYDSELGDLPETSRKGYEFMGWFTAVDGEEEVTSASKIPAVDTTYFAKWKIEEYSISYDLNDEGSNKAVNPKSNKTKYTVEDETFTLKGPTWQKHAFIGWTNDTLLTPETEVVIEKGTTGDKEYKANWVVSDFTVSFDSQGGSVTEEQGAQLNGVILEPEVPVLKGYIFEGWYKEKECKDKWNFKTDKVSANLTLFAKWSLEEYSIEYNLNGGIADLTHPKKYTIKDSFILNEPTKEGYEFMGWTYGSIQEPSKSIFVKEGTTGDFVFVAHWQIETYSIEYDLKGGEAINKINYTYETDSFTLNNPTKLGYMFTGWTWDNHDIPVKEVTINKQSTGNKKYIANYEIVSYSITYHLDGGSATNPKYYTVDTETFDLVAPTKTGYEFMGWTWDNQVIPVKEVTIPTMSTGNKEFSANWKKLSYKVLFESNGGTSVDSQEVEYEGVLSQPSDMKKTGYLFDGWYKDVEFKEAWNFKDKVIEPMTLYAKWIVQQYTASFDGNGGNDGTSISMDYNTSLGVLPTSSREGYEFVGWYTDKTGGTLVTEETKMPVNGVTYYAQWKCRDYTIFYDLGSGINDYQNPASYTIEDELILHAPSLYGYVFTGWTWKDQTTPVLDVVINKGTTGNKSYLANWKICDYTVNFDTQGGSKVNSLGVIHGTPVTKPGNPVKEGYSFMGWYINSSGETQWNFEDGVTSNMTLFAKWKMNQYTAKFDGNGGTNGEDKVLNYQSSLGKLPISSREGYTFMGWTTQAIGGILITEETLMPLGDITFYAIWEINHYRVTFDTLGGNLLENKQVDYGQKIIQPMTPIKEGYVFDKWYKDRSLTKEWNDSEDVVLSDITLYAGYKVVPTLVSNIASGGVEKGTKLILSTLPKEGNIYYTIDGTIPTKESIPYHLPIEINQTTSIKAITIYDQVESPVYTFNYTVTGDILVSLDSDSSIVSGTKEEDLIDAILDEQDLKRYQQGEHIDIEIKCQPISLVPTSEIMSQLEGKNLANAYDITVFKQFMNEEKIQLSELNKPIQLVLNIPLQHLPKEDIDRVFTVMRIHGDKIEFLTDLDTNDKTVTIKTQLFSNYVLCYEDKAKKEPILPTQGPLPETGDKLSFAEWSVVSFVSFVVLVFVVVYKWNKKKKD